jgi:hypothetical protein
MRFGDRAASEELRRPIAAASASLRRAIVGPRGTVEISKVNLLPERLVAETLPCITNFDRRPTEKSTSR